MDIYEKALKTGQLDKKEILALLQLDEEQAKKLFDIADQVRIVEVGNDIHIRGLIEFSNHCKRRCRYCGLTAENRTIKRYRMEIEEIFEAAKAAEALGYKSIVMQSGEDPYYTADRIAKLVDMLKNKTQLAVTLSAGEFSYNDYKKIREAGADRYLLRFETSDENLYRSLHPDSELSERLECLDSIIDLKYQTGSGFMVGLPGETDEIMADNLLLLKKLDVDMAGIGPFLSNPDTPLANEKSGTILASLKAIALTRLILRNSHIPATTAMGTLDKEGRQKALKSGANVVMPNVTPLKYREMYLLYPNKICLTDDAAQNRDNVVKMIKSINREPAQNQGHSLKKKEKNYE